MVEQTGCAQKKAFEEGFPSRVEKNMFYFRVWDSNLYFGQAVCDFSIELYGCCRCSELPTSNTLSLTLCACIWG